MPILLDQNHNRQTCICCFPIGKDTYISDYGIRDVDLLKSLRYLLRSVTTIDKKVREKSKVVEEPDDLGILDAPMFQEYAEIKKMAEYVPIPNVYVELYKIFESKIICLLNRIMIKTDTFLSKTWIFHTIAGSCPTSCNCCWKGKDQVYKLIFMDSVHIISCLLYKHEINKDRSINYGMFPGTKTRPMVTILNMRIKGGLKAIQDYAQGDKSDNLSNQSSKNIQTESLDGFSEPDLF